MEARQRRVLVIVMINIGTCAMLFGAAYLSQSSALLSGTLDNMGEVMPHPTIIRHYNESIRPPP